MRCAVEAGREGCVVEGLLRREDCRAGSWMRVARSAVLLES